MGQLTARVSPESVRRITALLDRPTKETYPKLRKTFNEWGSDWRRKVEDRISNAPGGLHRRSSRLFASLHADVTGSDLASLKLRCFTAGVNYANMQEQGGEIRPKNARFLTIPTAANLTNQTGSGVPRFPSARAFIANHPKQTFFLRRASAAGGEELLLMWRDPSKTVRSSVHGKKGESVAMFRLVRKVELQGPRATSKSKESRFAFFKTWHDLASSRAKSLEGIAHDIGGSL